MSVDFNNGCPPPVLFTELIEAELEADLKPPVDDLLRAKREAPDLGEGKRIDRLNEYIEERLVSLRAVIDEVPRREKSSWDRLNSLFLSLLD